MLVYVSANSGVDEVYRAIWHFLKWIDGRFEFEILEINQGDLQKTVKSFLLKSEDNGFLELEGTLQWICQSPFRPHHQRKNWFFALNIIDELSQDIIDEKKIVYQSMKSSKNGGQHVNTTCSAVRAVYPSLGIEAISCDERSSHQNKKIAFYRLLQKADDIGRKKEMQQEKQRWGKAKIVKRGDAVRVFIGIEFNLKPNSELIYTLF